MKVLFLIGLLALVEARELNGSPLQHLSEQEPEQEKGQSQDASPLIAIADAFNFLYRLISGVSNRVDRLQAILAAAGQGYHEGEATEGGENGDGGQSIPDEAANAEKPVNPTGQEVEPPNTEESETNKEGEKGGEPSGNGNEESAIAEQTDTRMIVQKIQSRLDEIKREQKRMKLSEALTRILKEGRRQ